MTDLQLSEFIRRFGVPPPRRIDWYEVAAGVAFALCLILIYGYCFIVGPALLAP